MEEAGRLTQALVYDVLRDEAFWAERGVGAYLGGKRLKVSGRDTLAQALFGVGLPFLGQEVHPRVQAQVAEVCARSSGVRRNGVASLDLAYVAAGRLDGYWEANLKPWDVAAGLLLCEEAGAVLSDYSAKPIGHSGQEVVVAAPLIADQLLALLQG